jgi:hypothetical protein
MCAPGTAACIYNPRGLDNIVQRAMLVYAKHEFILVLHRALPDLQRTKLLLFCGVVGTEVGIPLVRLSPLPSWTRGSWSTSDCRHGPSSAPEHAC